MKFPWDKYEELPLSKRNTLQMFITNRCNLKCEGCFARNAMGDGQEITLTEYQQVILKGIGKRVKQINILGGEPTLHPKLDSMCLFNAEHDLKTTVYTNGTHLGNNYKYYHGAKIRVSLDSFAGTKKSVQTLLKSGFSIEHIDANYMTTTKSTAIELYNAANWLEFEGCKVFFIFNMCEMANPTQEFFDSSASDLVLPVLEYKKLIHDFMTEYNGDMEIHVSKRGVFESTKSLPHNKCKFSNYFIGGKYIQCPYDIVNLKWQDDYDFDTRYCQQNSTCLMSKLKFQRRKNEDDDSTTVVQ